MIWTSSSQPNPQGISNIHSAVSVFGGISARLARLGSSHGVLGYLLAVALCPQFLKAELGGAAEEQLLAVGALLLWLPPLRLLLLLLLCSVFLEPL